jgi:hypothetical protein
MIYLGLSFIVLVLASWTRSQVSNISSSWLQSFLGLLLKLIFFSISLFNIELVEDSISWIFSFFFIRLSQSHIWDHRLNVLTRVDLFFIPFFRLNIFSFTLQCLVVWDLNFVVLYSLLTTRLSQPHD